MRTLVGIHTVYASQLLTTRPIRPNVPEPAVIVIPIATIIMALTGQLLLGRYATEALPDESLLEEKLLSLLQVCNNTYT